LDPVNVIIEGELSPDAPPFQPTGSAVFDLSSRPVTEAKAHWSVPPWAISGEMGPDQTSTNIASVIQEIIDLPGWESGNSIVLIIRDDPNNPSVGMREAEHAHGDPDACWLHVEYENYPLNPDLAFNPSPASGQTDVPHDAVLIWTSAADAAQTNGQIVYLGESFDDVNDATGGVAQTAASFATAQNLDFLKTYFWRVDQVTADQKINRGFVWSFEVEPYSFPIPSSGIVVTASSAGTDFSTPEKTIDGSGLGVDDTHAITEDTMWFTASVDLDPWIQYEFDDVTKLDTMKVWNSNGIAEMAIGWGVKDVLIEYSTDGENWEVLADVNQFSRASGSPAYNQYDEIAFNGTAAKYVRFDIQSNWGGILMSYGLSEVQFTMIPAQVRTSYPVSGAVDVPPSTIVTWRSGRGVSQHTVYVSTDQNEVADGLAPSVTSSTNSLDLASLNLQLGETYYWRVDEVNDAEVPPVWAGPVWSLSTSTAVVVDDFESYSNESPNRPFQTWTDGFGYSADEFFPAGYGGNGTGAGVGHDIWSLASPQYNGDIMETDIVISGSAQSMPFNYNNASETTRTFAEPQNWTTFEISTLSLWFFGDAGNDAATLYVKINDSKVNYDGNVSDLTQAGWHAWNISLSAFNTNLQSVNSMSIGVEGNNVSGVLTLDDIRLYAQTGEMFTPIPPDDSALIGHWTLDGNFDDSSGLGNHGMAGGDPPFVAGPGGAQAVDFSVTASYLAIDGVADDIADENALTVSLWIKTTSTDRSILVGANDSGGGHNFILGIDNGNVYFNGVASETLFPPSLKDDQWHLVTFVRDGVQGTLYVDGFLRGTASTDLSLADMTLWSLGQEWDGADTSDHYWGQMADVRFYGYALSTAEIASLAGLTSPMHKPF
ncbi:MAG: discoidin domain-containing protein, partial [Phycisphaeraceae bacterium]|nr:discoidin domain-containing protein [Phycisphaeraceae bacterium]